jgi:hypothetical protein
MKTRTFQFAEYGQPTDVLQLAVNYELGSNRGFSLTGRGLGLAIVKTTVRSQ